MPVILVLKKDRDASVARRHPWLFAGSVARRSGDDDGLAEVRDASGAVRARGFSSPNAPIVARLLTFGSGPLDGALVAERVAAAARLREKVVPPRTDGYRLVHAEGDSLPGLVVDRYANVLVTQATTEGTERARRFWLPPLAALFPGFTIVAKNDLPSRAGEGLSTKDEVLVGDAIPDRVPFRERGLTFLAEIATGQKTGFFLDQRENRHLVRELSRGKRVLNLFSYSGAFGVAALEGGASRVAHVDVSAPALASAQENHERNGQDLSKVDLVAADVFEDLRARVARKESWDVVVTDPPAFAKKKQDVDRACRGYKDVNRLALKLLAPGGTLLACSCSGPVDAVLFQKVLFAASLDAGVPARLVEKRGAGPDHPVSLDCPEGEYLKAFRLER